MNDRFVSARFPYLVIELVVQAQAFTLEALLDTGFDGHVAVPAEVVAELGPADGISRWGLANGAVVRAPYFLGSVRIGGLAAFPAAIIALGDEALVGLSAIERFAVILDHGREVIVEP